MRDLKRFRIRDGVYTEERVRLIYHPCQKRFALSNKQTVA